MTSKICRLFLVWVLAIAVAFSMAATPDPQVLELLSSKDKPIHIGDGIGDNADIVQTGHFNNHPPHNYTWNFTLDKLPERAEVSVTIFSLAGYRFNCVTALLVNNEMIKDLGRLPDVGPVDSRATLPLPANYLKLGQNTLIIQEDPCGAARSRNDSLIKEVNIILY